MNNESIKKIALSNGFKLKQQTDGSMELNPYVYDFAKYLSEELLKENAELRSTNEFLRSQFKKYMQTADISIYMDAMNSTPTQHLADIKADAVVKFTEHVKYNFEGIMSDDALIDFGNEYINSKLRGESK